MMFINPQEACCCGLKMERVKLPRVLRKIILLAPLPAAEVAGALSKPQKGSVIQVLISRIFELLQFGQFRSGL
jgi:hypothetical protein